MCYGILYGMGVQSLAERLQVSCDQAAGFLERFKQTFKGHVAFKKICYFLLV